MSVFSALQNAIMLLLLVFVLEPILFLSSMSDLVILSVETLDCLNTFIFRFIMEKPLLLHFQVHI